MVLGYLAKIRRQFMVANPTATPDDFPFNVPFIVQPRQKRCVGSNNVLQCLEFVAISNRAVLVIFSLMIGECTVPSKSFRENPNHIVP